MAISKEFLKKLKDIKVLQKKTEKNIRTLMAELQQDKIIIPAYQRSFVWESDIQCRFIESIFMNVPIPAIFLLEKNDGNGKIYEVLDGVQRLSTLKSFYNSILRLKNLVKLPDLNQVNFSNLSPELSELFLEQKISLVIISETTSPDIRFEVFERLNQGSVALNAQELRNCMYHGDFNDFLMRLSDKPIYTELLANFGKFKTVDYGKPDKNRMMDVEMILRFFAMYEKQKISKDKKYNPPRKEFLNSYMDEKVNRKIESSVFSSETLELEKLFDKTIDIVKSIYSNQSFKRFAVDKNSAAFLTPFNKAIFDIQMLGFVDYQKNEIKGKETVIYNAFLDMCSYEEKFITAAKTSTDAQADVRLQMWKNKLRHVVENFSQYSAKYNKKCELLNESNNCHICNNPVKTLEESDVYESKLAHRYCILNQRENTPIRPKTQFVFTINDDECSFDEFQDALIFIFESIAEKINDNNYEVQRLCSLDFIDTYSELSKKLKDVPSKKMKPTNLKKDGKIIYVEYSGTLKELRHKLKDLTSLYDFIVFVE